jgi:putative MATE family efflux protein
MLGSPAMLRLMAVPEDVMPEAVTYLRIYFGGISGLLFYNMGAGILRAVGDSRRPMIFLVFSAISNIILDLVFVLVFSMGTAGVAYATIISQFLSAILVLLTLIRSEGAFKLVPKKIGCTWTVMGKIVNIGLPTSVQQGVTSFSNVFIQSYINVFGSAVMAGWSSYSKIDQFILLPMQAVAFASTTFVGQNWGAEQYDRAKKGLRTAMELSLLMTAALIPPLMIFSRQFIYMFNQDPAVLEYGSLMIRYLSPFYLLCCVNQIYAGALRGVGNSRVPMVIMLSSFVAFRQVYMAIFSNLLPGNIVPVILGYPAGWLLASLALFIYYDFGRWEGKYKIAACDTYDSSSEPKAV